MLSIRVWSQIRSNVYIGDALLWEENLMKLSGLIVESVLTSNSYVKLNCKKASQKLTAILRLANSTSKKKKKLLKTFFESQFSHCSLLEEFTRRCFAVAN